MIMMMCDYDDIEEEKEENEKEMTEEEEKETEKQMEEGQEVKTDN